MEVHLLLFHLFAVGLSRAGSEYASPASDPDHGGSFTMPNERIDTFSGALTLVEKDMSIPGPNGFNLDIVRWYSSKFNNWDANCLTVQRERTPLGVGWQMHMGRVWVNPSVSKPVPAYRLELPGGQNEAFYNNSVLGVPNADYVASGSWSLRDGSCVGAVATCMIAASPAGIEFYFPISSSYRMDLDDSSPCVAAMLNFQALEVP